MKFNWAGLIIPVVLIAAWLTFTRRIVINTKKVITSRFTELYSRNDVWTVPPIMVDLHLRYPSVGSMRARYTSILYVRDDTLYIEQSWWDKLHVADAVPISDVLILENRITHSKLIIRLKGPRSTSYRIRAATKDVRNLKGNMVDLAIRRSNRDELIALKESLVAAGVQVC